MGIQPGDYAKVMELCLWSNDSICLNPMILGGMVVVSMISNFVDCGEGRANKVQEAGN